MQADWAETHPNPIRWKDDFSNLFEVIDWNK